MTRRNTKGARARRRTSMDNGQPTSTFLVPSPDTEPLSSAGLIAWRARQLQKHQDDLESICERVLKARFESIKHFEAAFKNRIRDFDFRHGSLVLV